MEKKLSEYIEAYRIDRPDEWTMDEFVRKAAKLEAGRNELAAQVEALQKTVVSVKARCNILQNLTLQLIHGAELSGSDWDYISEAQATEIQHHLRQVRADAGRDGFIAGYMLCNDDSSLIKHNYEGFANQYHASILAGKE